MSALLDSLKALDDPARYTRRAGVPVFTPHTKTVNGQEHTVTADDLHAWAAEMAALEQANGVAGVIRCGHIRPDLPEDQQPKTIGAYRNPRVAPHPISGKPAVLVDEYAAKDFDPRNFPHRSVEFYRDKKRITAVAWLARDPQLPDLGVNLFAAGPDGLECYSLGADTMADDTKPKGDDTPTSSPDDEAMVAKILPALIAALQAQGLIPAAAPQPAPAPVPAAPPGPPVTMSNPATPELFQLKAQLTTYEATNRQLAEQVKVLADGVKAAKTEALLKELAVERYSFDAAAEHTAMMATDDAGREARAAVIRAYHQKLPGDGLIETYTGPVEGPAGEHAKAQAAHLRATEHMRAHPGMTYEAAVAATSK